MVRFSPLTRASPRRVPVAGRYVDCDSGRPSARTRPSRERRPPAPPRPPRHRGARPACAAPSPRCCAADRRDTASAPGGTSCAYDGPGAGRGAVADRRPGRRTCCCEPVRACRPIVGAVLGDAVVVGEDRARADVGALADLGVADVGQVRHLGAVADLGVLGLDEARRSCRRRRARCRAAGRRTARRSRRRRSPRSSPWVRTTRGAGADLDVLERAVRARRPRPRRPTVAPSSCTPGQDRDVAARAPRRRRSRCVAGSTTVTPSRIQRSQDPAVELGGRGRRAGRGRWRPRSASRRRCGARRRPRPSRAGDRRRRRSGSTRPWRCRC